VKKHKTKGKHGESVIQIGVELPQDLLAYMQAYDGKPITDKEWEKYADNLKCEVNVLKAIAKVESGGHSAFWTVNDTANHKLHAPKILFERHKFSKATSGKYDDAHPDVSWPYPYKQSKQLGGKDRYMHDGVVGSDDIYNNSKDYLRLLNAYRLDQSAALMSASWGKFQILGSNYKLCGEVQLEDFVRKMCANEAGQVELLASFIRNNKLLWEAVKDKDWPSVARNYNGPKYKKYNYDTQLKVAYENYCKNTG
jgi:hypothetical protein